MIKKAGVEGFMVSNFTAEGVLVMAPILFANAVIHGNDPAQMRGCVEWKQGENFFTICLEKATVLFSEEWEKEEIEIDEESLKNLLKGKVSILMHARMRKQLTDKRKKGGGC